MSPLSPSIEAGSCYRTCRPETRHNRSMEEALQRVEDFIRAHDLIPPGGEVTCLVSGGADSTCLWLILRDLGYAVSAVHVNHKLRGEESEEDAAFCRDILRAEVIEAPGATGEAHARTLRFA